MGLSHISFHSRSRTMEALEGLWRKLKLSDEEETGVKYTENDAAQPLQILAAKFLTKRMVNIESVARTFKPLWRPQGDLKIKDMGDNKNFFTFEDEYDLERVLEHEPWTYDKHLVIFERVEVNVPISALSFQYIPFWVQIHDLPVHCLTPEFRDSIGSSLGTLLQMSESEGEGSTGNFLRVRVKIDITKPLSRVRKVWSAGKVIGWAALRYERLPNFCYWCGRVSHDDRDCELWLKSKGSLKKEDQQYGEWLRAEGDQNFRKTSMVVAGYRPYSMGKKKQAEDNNYHQANVEKSCTMTVSPEESTNSLQTAAMEKTTPIPLPTEKESPKTDTRIPDVADTLAVTDLAMINSRNNCRNYAEGTVMTSIKGEVNVNSFTTDPREPTHSPLNPTTNHNPLKQAHSNHTHELGPIHSEVNMTPTPPTTKPTTLTKAHKTTWTRMIRNTKNSMQEETMIDFEPRRESIQTEDLRPSKRLTLTKFEDAPQAFEAEAATQPRQET